MKKVLYVIIGLVVVYLILCFAGPKASKIERTIVINAPMEAVNAAIIDHKVFHDKWSPWTEKDPGMKVTFEGEMGKPGHKMSWESDSASVGIGSMTINSISADSIIQTLRFDNHESKIYHILKNENGATSVIWGLSSEFPFFARGIVMLMNAEKHMEEMIAPDFEKGLVKLKTYVESTPTAANYEVKEVDWTEKTFVGKKELVTFDKIAEFYGTNLGKIMGELGKNKIEPQMAPLGIFWTFDEQKQQTEMAVAMCVPKGTQLKGYETWDVPASKVLHVVYYGDYAKSMAAHMAMEAYMTKNNLKQSLVIEEYANDPMEVKDTAQWMTNIYYILMPSGK